MSAVFLDPTSKCRWISRAFAIVRRPVAVRSSQCQSHINPSYLAPGQSSVGALHRATVLAKLKRIQVGVLHHEQQTNGLADKLAHIATTLPGHYALELVPDNLVALF